MNGFLLLLIWFLTILVATVLISQYIRRYQKADVAIAFYVMYLVVSQVMAAKIGDFSIGTWQITAPTAVLIVPFTFQITDIVNEQFGQKETHRMIMIAFASQFLMAIFFWFSIEISPAIFWENQGAWEQIFGSTIRITLASWIAFLTTENLDAVIYAKIKEKTQGKHLWIRNVFSDIPTLALDSIIFITIAFAGGDIPIGTLIWGQMLTKWFFGIIDTPFIYLSRGIMQGKISLFSKATKVE